MLRIVLSFCVLLAPSMGQIKMIKDLNGNDPTNPEPCLLTCAGSTGDGKTRWQGEPGRVQITVDISKCGFVTTPILTTSLNGLNHASMVGMTSPWGMTKNLFTVTIIGEASTAWSPANWKLTPEQACQLHWNVNWIAVGFTC